MRAFRAGKSTGRWAKLSWAARAGASLSLIGLLAACAGHGPVANSGLTANQEAAVYKSHAKTNYAPPGPPTDPWGPFVFEASKRFDVPDTWIRQVMRVESGGYQFRASGELTTSPVGAMGLMQLMPETYDEMRGRYGLTDDAFDPHNNILAGAAYLREMYDAFGSPGFLAAYNAGPARLEDYLTHNRPLPDETRRYVSMIGSRISGIWPVSRSPAEQLAVNQIPINIPAGPRWVRHTVMVASRDRRRHQAQTRYAALQRHGHVAASAPVEVAEAPEPRARGTRAGLRIAAAPQIRMAMSLPARHGGLHLISPAMASESMAMGGGRNWAVQIGAYGNRQQAAAALGAHGNIGHATVAAVQAGHATLYRARLGGMTHAAAVQACQRLGHHKSACLIVSPASQ
jgi:hypothetical protein